MCREQFILITETKCGQVAQHCEKDAFGQELQKTPIGSPKKKQKKRNSVDRSLQNN